jgi:predicted amidohydrolase
MVAETDLDLLVLPELFATGYFFHDREDLVSVAEPIPEGRTTRALIEWAEQTGATLVAGLAESAGDAIYNSAVVVGPKGVIGVYRKIHLYFEEKLWFTAGDLGFPVFEVADRGGQAYRLGVMICFDWRFPESARALALQGADIIAHPSNLVRKNCPRTMPIRALENHVYTITANRHGEESRGDAVLRFIGQSLACSPDGDVLVQAGRDESGIWSADMDPAMARQRQLTLHNHLFGDRRVEFYEPLSAPKDGPSKMVR